MKRSITQIFVLLVSLVSLFFVIDSNKEKEDIFSRLYINSTDLNEIIKSKKETNQLLIHNLRFNGFSLISDKNNNVYYSLIDNDDSAYDPLVKWSSKNVEIRFNKEFIDDNIISSSKK